MARMRWLFSLTLAMLVLACGTELAKASAAPAQGIGKQESQGERKNTQTIQDMRGTENSPLFVRVAPPLPTETQPSVKAETSHQFWTAEWMLAILTFFLVLYTALLWTATRALAREALATSTRMAHMDLLKLALSDGDVRDVWMSDVPTTDPKEFKRHLFIGLHLSLVETLLEVKRLSEEQVRIELDEHFKNSYYKTFWEKARLHRAALDKPVSSKPSKFNELCEAAYSKQPKPQPAGKTP